MSKNVDGVKVQNQGDLVIYNGHKYQYNKDITSILFMGVDRDKINTDEEYLKKHGAGQSDTLFLAAVNTSTGKISLINVPRDIMANVKTYDENGKYSGRKLRQLCLAYAYGDGKAKSCKNAVDAVSKVLYGIPIDSYMSINLSAISVLNDAVGGVNVQVIGDLTSVDPTLKEGANVTLLGGYAETTAVYYSICPESITGDEGRSYIAIRSSESCIREFSNESFSTEDHISCNESFRKQFFI